VVDGIRLTVSVFCSVPFLLAVALLFLYEIDKPMESRIERELKQRRQLAEEAA
jgi:Na+/melibiose symporter-like transporter